MNKFLKIFLITLLSLIGLALIGALVLMWIVFTPSRITHIANDQANKMLACQTEIGRVELTFFKTFPKFGIDIDGLTLINPMEGSPSDTLLHVSSARVAIDIRALVRRNELIVSDLSLTDGNACIYFDADGKANFDIYESESNEEEDTGEIPFELIDLGTIRLNNVSLAYADDASGMAAHLNAVSADVKANMKRNGDLKFDVDMSVPMLAYEDRPSNMSVTIENLSGKLKGEMLGSGKIVFDAGMNSGNVIYDDRSGNMFARVDAVALRAKGSMEDDRIVFDADLDPTKLWYVLDGETLADGLKAAIYAKGEFVSTDDSYGITLNEARLLVNDLSPLNLTGEVIMKTEPDDIETNLDFDIADWNLAEVIGIVPESYFAEYKGLSLEGMLTAKGNIKGIYNDDSVPRVSLDLNYRNGSVGYPEMLPFDLHGVQAQMFMDLDMNGDTNSYARIDRLELHTPKSFLQTSGRIGNIMGDMNIALDTTLDLLLDEVSGMIPEDMNTAASGRISGTAYTAFTMSQLKNMQLNRMKLKGNLFCRDLDVDYDGVAVRTPDAKVVFALPNPHPAQSGLGFSGIQIESGKLMVDMYGDMYAELENTKLNIETADVISESTDVQPILCDFDVASVQFRSDDMSASIVHPRGNIMILPSTANPANLAIDMSYAGDSHYAEASDMKAVAGPVEITLSCAYDPDKTEIMGQWSPSGTLFARNINIETSAFEEPVDIPVVELALDPEALVIKEMKGNFGNSDFALSGNLQNLEGYLEKGSPLSGEFRLYASHIDLTRIMNATSGLGTDEQPTAEEREAANEEGALAGPYMVPENMDITFHANIDSATFEDSVFTDIKGTATVSGSQLEFSELEVKTPGADILFAAKYRTEYRNHIFAGIGLHMFNIEIAELINMLPLVDTLIPMLRSLDGKGEFHTAVEFYTDSAYVVKKSTLRGAMSVTGSDLQVLPSDVYNRISKLLLFSKKTRNSIDHFSAEMTIFRNEIDIYPFEISMDKYRLIVSGRHNMGAMASSEEELTKKEKRQRYKAAKKGELDMELNYNISVAQSPLPFRLAVNVTGFMDDPKIRLGRNRVMKYYRPVWRGQVSQQQIDMGLIVRERLLENVQRITDGESESNQTDSLQME